MWAHKFSGFSSTKIDKNLWQSINKKNEIDPIFMTIAGH
jgi:hypothetical protein